ncbi:probable ATP-dependent RNA helicase CG8611 [Bemisia tabaci]|uniref:probable ATP-dependent RNA helicase CG8611 n=1 Tax=Bemisia tabaci TaxID=7038 RepID=UPI003B286A1D
MAGDTDNICLNIGARTLDPEVSKYFQRPSESKGTGASKTTRVGVKSDIKRKVNPAVKKVNSALIQRSSNVKPKFGKPADESHKEKHLLSAGSNKPKKGETNSGNEIGQGPKKVSTNTYGPTSSLFRKNPEVPQVENKSIKPKNEAVFSSKFFKDVAELHPHTVKNLADVLHVTQMTQVQELTLFPLLEGKDLLVCSQTGSGKTLAYALPIVEMLQKKRPEIVRSDGVKALVVLPTRELALQTYECFVKLVKPFTRLVPGLLVGGEKRKSEKARLRKGVNILVGTPGRLLDHAMHTCCLQLSSVEWLILDEADRLLDLGYERDVASLVRTLDEQQKNSRQTILLSATLTSAVEKLAGLALKNAERIDVSDSIDHELVIPDFLCQCYTITPPKLRLAALGAFIIWKCSVETAGKMLVFMATQDMVDYHHDLFNSVINSVVKKKILFSKLHGNMTQQERFKIFNDFRQSTSGVLMCTDVAARGIDVPKVDWIIQYTAPVSPAYYVHRVGRTARAGEAGSALLFLVPSEVRFIELLQERQIRLIQENAESYLEKLLALRQDKRHRQEIGSTMESAATYLQLEFEKAVLENKELHNSASNAYISWIRFYSTYPKEVRSIFPFKEIHLGHMAKSFALRDPPSNISRHGKVFAKKSGPSTKQISSSIKPGKKRKLTPADRLRILTNAEFESGLPSKSAKFDFAD